MAGKRDLDPGASPQHFFGAEVRRSREAAGMTLAGLGAQWCRVMPQLCRRVEKRQVSSVPLSGSPKHAMRRSRRWAGGLPGSTGASLKWDGPYPQWFEDWVDAEGRAAILRGWEPLLVPGLLQTPEYARALFRAWRTDDDEDKIEQLVTARMDRQRIFDRPGPPSFWAVLDEGVLRRRIGSVKVMHDQLVRLADQGRTSRHQHSRDPGRGWRARGAAGGLRHRRTWPVTRRVSSTSSRRMKGRPAGTPVTVAKIVLTFETLRSEALPRGASRDLILKVAGEYGRDLEEVQLQRR